MQYTIWQLSNMGAINRGAYPTKSEAEVMLDILFTQYPRARFRIVGQKINTI